MSDDRGEHGLTDAPDCHVAKDPGQQFQKLHTHRFVVVNEVAEPEPAFFRTGGFDRAESELHAAGNDGRKRRAPDLHFRKAKEAVDQDGVQDQVQYDRRDAEGRALCDSPGVLEYGQERMGKAQEEIRETDDLKVLDTEFNEDRIVGEKGHQKPRGEHGRREEQKRRPAGDLQGEGQNLFHRNVISFAPVLRAHRGDDHVDGDEDHVQDKVHLRRQRDCGKRILTERRKHQCVRSVHEGRQKTLKRDRQADLQDLSVKGLRFKNRLFFLLRFGYGKRSVVRIAFEFLDRLGLFFHVAPLSSCGLAPFR